MEQRQAVTAHSPSRPEIDWRVNVASLVGLVIAVLTGGVWLGNIDSKVGEMEGRVREQGTKIEAVEDANLALLGVINQVRVDVAVLGSQGTALAESLRRIEAQLEAHLRSNPSIPSTPR